MTKTDSSPTSPPRTPNFDDYTPKADGYAPRNAYLLASCANLAYEKPDEIERQTRSWGLTDFQFLGETEDLGFQEVKSRFSEGKVVQDILKGAGTEGFIARGNGFAIVSFRGTEEVTDFLTDANALQVRDPGERGELHSGFHGALSAPLRAGLKKVVGDYAEKGLGIWVTGHSLGGALATLAAADLAFAGIELQGVYTFGQPRVCCPDFAKVYDERLCDRHFRFVNNNDIVTEAPLKRVKYQERVWRYRHVGQRIYIKTSGQLTDDIGRLELTMDRAAGYVTAALEGDFADGVSDHSMVHYLAALEQNYTVDPTAEGAEEPRALKESPAPKEPPPPKPREVARKTAEDLAGLLEKHPVEFALNRAELTDESKKILDDAFRLLSGAPPDTRFSIEGHTDNTGTPEGNRELSLERAEAVRDYLVGRSRLDSLDTDRFKTEGFGQNQPVATNDTAEGQRKNRRVEIRLLE